MVRQIKRQLKNIIFRYIKPEVKIVYVNIYQSYAQVGEDIILKYLFNSIGTHSPSYIDVGCHKPDFGNNTYKFYLEGSKGVSVEPDPNLISTYKQQRPKDICINAAIGFDNSSETEFYIFNEPSLNTMSKDEAKRRDSIGEYKIVDTIIVPVIRLEEIIESRFSNLPDFISLDAEGVDFDILKSFDFLKYPIPVWVVETVDYSVDHIKIKNLQINEFMKLQGYFVFADTYINTIFVNKSWYHGFQKNL